jgi:peptide/nickel transport system permease protein
VIRFLAVRAAQAAVIVFLVTSITFVLIHAAPGSPFVASGEANRIPPETIERLERQFGFDRPIAEQYVRYLANVVRGEFGYSFSENRPVRDAFLERVPNTILLAGSGLLIMFSLGIAVGAIQGTRPGSRSDDILSLLTLAVYSMPIFWLGLMSLLLFGLVLHWLPVGGTHDPVIYGQLGVFGKLGDRLQHLTLPAITLGMIGAATIARYQRAAVLDVMRLDFVRTARAKGLGEPAVLMRHALRNALLPAITLFGLAFPLLLSGAVLVETVFSWPGLGKLAVDAVQGRDYFMVTGAAIVTAILVVLGSFIADVLYRWVDPRTREQP